ncbi:MAG: hypothetical protein JSW07_06195 [bacterium]|nr:MAG: hypothetical protein JSW07_06195 [bacterium]
MIMKKFAIVLLAGGIGLSFFQIAQGTVYQNKDCLRCHDDPKLVMSGKNGNFESLHVDSLLFARTLHGVYLLCVDCHIDADTTSHPNTGYTDVNCLACHSNLVGYFPPNAKETLQRKGRKIPEKKIVGEKYLQSKHGQVLLKGDPDAPQCYDCHTQHYVKPKIDLKASIHLTNLPKTCSPCHEEGKKAQGLMNKFASFRIKGHRKEDLAEKYIESNCQGCHYGASAHGEEAPEELTCPNCHFPQQGKKVVFAPLHNNVLAGKQPVPHVTASFYWIVSPFVIAGIIILIGIFLFKKYRIKDDVLLKIFPLPTEN